MAPMGASPRPEIRLPWINGELEAFLISGVCNTRLTQREFFGRSALLLEFRNPFLAQPRTGNFSQLAAAHEERALGAPLMGRGIWLEGSGV